MTLITATAFLLAVRLNALVVAVLGIAGGFLTPVLLSTGQDNPFGLFGYVALLDVGLLLVARRKDWAALPILGGIGTAVLQIAWVGNFFLTGHYFAGNRTLIPMAIFLGFEALFCAAAITARRDGKLQRTTSGAALGVAGFALFWAFYFLSSSAIGSRPALLFSYLFFADAGLLALVFAKEYFGRLVSIVGLVAFAFLGVWTHEHLNAPNLYTALGAYFLFAVLHASIPLVMQRLGKATPAWVAHLFPAATLLLVLLPIFKLGGSSLSVWPLVFGVDLLAILIAVLTGAFAAVIAVLALTIFALGAWICEIPANLSGFPLSLSLIGAFAVFFVAAAAWMSRRGLQSAPGRLFGDVSERANFAVQLPALSATLPFLLLVMATLQLPLSNPTPIFAVALLLIVLLLGLTKILSLDLLACVALGSSIALEHAWHFTHFKPEHAVTPLLWYLGFATIFTIFPFIFHRQFAGRSLVWASAAVSAPLHFLIVYQLVRATHSNGMPGLLPALFALPSLLGLVVLLKRTPLKSGARDAQLALFAGAALFFVTLIFPIQFDREWITLGWALEGAALCWLFHRVPHPGLRITGVGLLIVAFSRLTLNPAVLNYHARAATPIFNWYLYTYVIAAVCSFAAAKLLAPPRHLVLNKNAPPLLYTMGTILAFLLLNIEIADYFSTLGSSALTFQFTGNFARDMSYSIAWSLFALLLLVVGIRKRTAEVRWAGLVLLGVAVLKLFLHDLSQLDQLYRIAAFIVVAVIAIIASFLYQRFLGAAGKQAQ